MSYFIHQDLDATQNLLDTSARTDAGTHRQSSWTPMDLPPVSDTTRTAFNSLATPPDTQLGHAENDVQIPARERRGYLVRHWGTVLYRACQFTNTSHSVGLTLPLRPPESASTELHINLIILHEGKLTDNEGNERKS